LSQEIRYNPEYGEEAFYYFVRLTVKTAPGGSGVSTVRVALLRNP